MKKENLKRIIDELNKLPETKIDMDSISEPECGTPGCFAGLIYLIMNKIPEIKEIYNKNKNNSKYNFYNYIDIGDTLSIYLGFENINNLYIWIYNNSEIWGKGYEYFLLHNCQAWEQKYNIFSSKIIINKLESVYSRL